MNPDDFDDDFGGVGVGDDFDFDAVAEAKQAQRRSDEPVPAGWYKATIGSAKVKTTKNGSGRYVEVKFEIQHSEYDGHQVYKRLMFESNSPKAQDIGRRQIGEIAGAIGLETMRSPRLLVGGVLQIDVTVEEYEGKQNNGVKGWKPA
jgi:hypothetical protein